MDGLAEWLAACIGANPWVAPLAAFLGGLLTAANPCVIAMVPLMVGYVGGQEEITVRRSFLLALTFSLGLTVTFLVLFLVTWVAASFLRASWWNQVAAAVCVVMGLHLLGILHLRLPAPSIGRPRYRGFAGALLLGLLFGLVSLPCAGPVLLALLAIVSVEGKAYGGLLLISYSLGHCGLVLIGGTSIGLVRRIVESRGWDRRLRRTRQVAGALIVLVGLLLWIR